MELVYKYVDVHVAIRSTAETFSITHVYAVPGDRIYEILELGWIGGNHPLHQYAFVYASGRY